MDLGTYVDGKVRIMIMIHKSVPTFRYTKYTDHDNVFKQRLFSVTMLFI